MKTLFALVLALASFNGRAEVSAVYEKAVNQNLDTAYTQVKKALEGNGFKVVYELDIMDNMNKFAEKNAVKDYNSNKLEAIKSLVFCNGALSIKISNADPAMLALCPLHVTFTQKSGHATVLFARTGALAQGSKAEAPAKELEDKVIKTIESGLSSTQ